MRQGSVANRELWCCLGRRTHMRTKSKLRKSLAIAFAVALLAGACGSNDSAVSDDEPAQTIDTTEPDEPSVDAGPPEGVRRITFEFAPEDVIEDVYQGDLSTFEVRTASDDETVVIGFLDETGTIDIPIELGRGTIGVEAELPNDEFCWWSGFYTSISSDRIVTVQVELEEVCA